ncbi:glycoside hydrolase family 93 protein [Armillaria novae-zelandiae]|uniref:Glycoside hydrolase family 93 protein n=1 Tax=Armillaria novae-zelandiae TaxID=153914 RepID=A0AA39UIV6_9AGAR|nr:glycoside hydrolase family 93 protein [Armillaria novae-zelandiae]
MTMLFPIAAILFFAAVSIQASQSVEPFTAILFNPPADYIVPRTLYARTLRLANDGNVILATWENYSPEPPLVYFPVYRSTDLGQTWTHISNITDDVNGWGLRYQPFLYEMTENIGTFQAGTILCAGNSIPTNLSNTQIDLYASTDKGYTWKFVSHIAAGGEALPNNGLTPVWEPFILTYNQQIVVYYSDQRDPDHGQKLVHQVSSDLITWGEVVDDTAYDTYDWRPGMPTIAELPNGQFIFTYEFFGATEASFAVYYRLSDSPLTFDSAQGYVVKAATGQLPTSSPYVNWTPYGGVNGTIVVSANSHSGVFLNTDLAAPGSTWTYVATTSSRSYTREVKVMSSNNQIMLTGGGVLNGGTNTVTATVINL